MKIGKWFATIIDHTCVEFPARTDESGNFRLPLGEICEIT